MQEQPRGSFDNEEGSVTVLLTALKSGDSAAAGPLWERYFARLVSFAQGRLRKAGGSGAVEDEEDAALSAIESFLHGVRDGRFPHLENRNNLWQILVMVTKRKVIDQVERRNTAKRGGKHRRLDGAMDALASPGPTPDATALLVDQCRVLLDALSSRGPGRPASSPHDRPLEARGLHQRRDRQADRLRAEDGRKPTRAHQENLGARGRKSA